MHRFSVQFTIQTQHAFVEGKPCCTEAIDVCFCCLTVGGRIGKVDCSTGDDCE